MKETEKRKGTSNKPDDSKKKKKKWLIIVICLVLIAGVAEFGYLSSQSKKKEEAQKTAFDNVAVEVKDDYAETIPLTSEEKILKTEDLVEILKDGKADKNTKITKVSKDTIDTSKEGGYIITYTIETIDSLGNKATKDYKKTFTVTNTDEVAPVIKLNKDTVEITEGDAYDPSENIKSVKDDFDGNITKADKKPDEAGTAYYLIDSSKLDTSKAGEYKVKVTAANKAGNEAAKEFTVKVKAKKEDNSSSNNNNSGNSSSTSGKSNSTSGSKNNTGSSSNNKTQQNCTTVWVQDSAAWDETVIDQPAWDETVNTRVGDIVVCNGCGQKFNSYEEWDKHAGSFASQGDWSHGGYHVDGRYSTSVVHHDAITHVVHHEATGHNEQRCS